MSRTLLITSDFPPMASGIARQLYHTWRLLPEDKVLILAPKLNGSESIDGKLPIKVLRRPFPVSNTSLLARLIKSFLLLLYVWPLLKGLGITKLHCSAPMSTGFCGLVFKKTKNIPYVVYVYGGEIKKYSKFRPSLPFMKSILVNAQKIVSNSVYSASEFIDYFNIPKENFTVINPGVDTDRFIPGPRSGVLEERHNLKGKKVILTVARLVERKGHDMVLEALVDVAREISDIAYIIAGTGPDEKKLKRLSERLGLEDKVIFAGFVTDGQLPAYYQTADLYVMPNRKTEGVLEAIEGFGISFIEASACGKAVIGGKSGGVTDSIADGETGILVEPLDKKSIACAIIKLLQDGELARKMGENGRIRAEKYFRWECLSKKLEGLL